MTQLTADLSTEPAADASLGTFLIRYGLGAVMILGGVVVLIVSPGGLGVDGFAMAVGGGLSVVLFNVLFRLSLSSENDRAQEERARAYFDEHGEWPDEEPARQRRWVLPAGVVTYEQEQAQMRARQTAGSAG